MSPFTTIHARVRFKEDFECFGSQSGVTEVIRSGETIDPLQMDMTGSCLDPTSPDARWLYEVQSGVCHDWVTIPGSFVEVLAHWPA